MNRTSHANLPMKILSVSDDRADHIALRRSLGEIPGQMVTANTYRGAVHLLHRDDIAIVICKSNLPDGTWRNVLNCAHPSEKPILIVSSPSADEYLWAEVLNLGGFDVVAKPFNLQELRRALDSACLAARLKVSDSQPA